ncbi:MAG: iron-containing alcohol dehydrogenase [Chloroflexota bacterium]
MTAFQFATAQKIIFGVGEAVSLGQLARQFGVRALVITGRDPIRVDALVRSMRAAGITTTVFARDGEPTIEIVSAAVSQARDLNAELIVGIGGGSAIDTAKATAALFTNPGPILDYLEVIGGGHPLTKEPLPCIAVPTTAGAGAEATYNAVIRATEHHVKVSLRHPKMLPQIALVDPTLTYSLPPAVTAATGMDALTQVIEPYVSRFANPISDALAREGIQRAGALQRAYHQGNDQAARADMALISLMGGMALSNARLGAVHGLAGVIGGMYTAPHGAVCAALLPGIMRANIHALRQRAPESPIIDRYTQIARWVTGDTDAAPEDGVAWAAATVHALAIPPLSSYGIDNTAFPEIIAAAQKSSSMKGNPIALTDEELADVLSDAG